MNEILGKSAEQLPALALAGGFMAWLVVRFLHAYREQRDSFGLAISEVRTLASTEIKDQREFFERRLDAMQDQLVRTLEANGQTLQENTRALGEVRELLRQK